MTERFADTCKYCGETKEAGHAIRSVSDGIGYVMRLVGPDGHLFEQVVFPRAPEPISIRYQRFREQAFREGRGGLQQWPKQQQEDEMTVLQRVQSLDVNRATADDMIDLLTSALAVRGTYVEKALPVPEALGDGIRRLEAEIETHRKDSLERRRKEIAGQMTNLESVSEKRDRLQRELTDINAALGVTEEQPAKA